MLWRVCKAVRIYSLRLIMQCLWPNGPLAAVSPGMSSARAADHKDVNCQPSNRSHPSTQTGIQAVHTGKDGMPCQCTYQNYSERQAPVTCPFACEFGTAEVGEKFLMHRQAYLAACGEVSAYHRSLFHWHTPLGLLDFQASANTTCFISLLHMGCTDLNAISTNFNTTTVVTVI